MIESYIKSTKEFKNKDFKLFNINNLSTDMKTFWVICYAPCNIINDGKKNWILIDIKKVYLVNAQLYEISN